MRIALAGPIKAPGLSEELDPADAALAPPDRAGGTPVTLLARALLERGHEVVVVTLDPDVAAERVLSGPRLRIRIGPLRARHRGRDAYRAERGYLTGALRAERADLIHAHWTYEYALAALATRRPTLVTVHDWAPAILRLRPDPYRAVRLGMAAAVFARARHFTAPSPYLAGRVRLLRPGRARLVPNALDDAAFAPVEHRHDPPRLLAVNDAFDRRKNVTALLSAFALLRPRFPGCRLDLVGEGHAPGGEAEAWARTRGLAEGVAFHGPVPYARVWEFMTGASVLVHPSLEESFGLVLVEAMAAALPVVAGARSGAVPWVLGSGSAGVLTDVTSPERLAAAVGALLADPARAAEVGAAGYRHARTYFRASAVVDGYLRAYEDVAG